MKTFLESIVRLLDWMSCIIPNMSMEDDVEPPTNPIKYGMSVFGGLMFGSCAAFGMFMIVASFVCLVASYPITSCSLAIVLGLCIGLGYLRKKIRGKLNDN